MARGGVGAVGRCREVLSSVVGEWESVLEALSTGIRFKLTHSQYAIATNFGPNLLSVYTPGVANSTFQIDANLGHPGAVLNALIQVPDTASANEAMVVTLLPALPEQWSSGAITGARLRGGMSVEMSWSEGKLESATIVMAENARARDVRVVVGGDVVKEFRTEPGMVVDI